MNAHMEERRSSARREDDEWKHRIEDRLTAQEDRLAALEQNGELIARFMAGLGALNKLASWAGKVVKFLTPVVAVALAALTYFSGRKS